MRCWLKLSSPKLFKLFLLKRKRKHIINNNTNKPQAKDATVIYRCSSKDINLHEVMSWRYQHTTCCDAIVSTRIMLWWSSTSQYLIDKIGRSRIRIRTITIFLPRMSPRVLIAVVVSSPNLSPSSFPSSSLPSSPRGSSSIKKFFVAIATGWEQLLFNCHPCDI